MLEVRLIGRFDIKYDGKPVTISSRAAQSLFTYLILTAGVAHRREKLAGMFWPDASEAKARAYLRYELWRIRKSLATLSEVDYLISDDINISFDSSVEYWLDVAQLRNAGEGASVDDLINALSDIQGELLPGFYDEWITEEREHFQVLYEQRIRRLLEMLEKEQRWNDIPKWAESWISFGHAPEAAYRSLMVAYDALGDRVKVMATYERCVQALRELDLEPSEKTRALANKRTAKLHIPLPLTSFIGRERELEEVADSLSKSRLVTLTGAGGVGKTRLAIQVVAEILDMFPDGVWFLDLAPLSEAALVPNTLASLVGLPASGETSVLDRLIQYFRSHTALVIFDNCEHLISSCAQLVTSLLTSCQSLSVLATSRELLRVAGELPYRVPSLEIPKADIKSSLDALAATESVRLFTERAAFASPSFSISSQNALAIAKICQRLDGIPLAIELAAARVNVLGVEQILKRLDDRFTLLTGGVRTALPRYQTLYQTIEWSHSLLSEEERILFRRLAVFTGGWTLQAAEEVCSGQGIGYSSILDLLSQLVNKSLILVENEEAETRYRQLETIHQFAHAKLLETGDVTPLQERHLNYFLKLAETAEPHLRRSEQVVWLKRLDADHENLRTALAWAMGKPSCEQIVRLAGALGSFWYLRSYCQEGAGWLDQALGKTWNQKSKVETAARAKALYRRADIAETLDELDVMRTTAESALALCQQMNDVWGIAFSHSLIGHHHLRLGVFDSTFWSSLEQSLNSFRRLSDAWGESRALHWQALAFPATGTGTREEFLDLIQHAIARARASGDRARIAFSLVGLAIGLMDHGQPGDADSKLREAERLYTEIDSLDGIYAARYLYTHNLFARGDFEKAKAEAKQVIEYLDYTGEKNQQSTIFCILALLAEAEDDLQSALVYAQNALQLAREMGLPLQIAWDLVLVGIFKYRHGESQIALEYVREGLEFVRRSEVPDSLVVKLFDHVAGLLVERKTQAAVQILAFAESFVQLSAVRRDAIFDKPYFDRFLSAARERLTEVEFASAWEAGSKMGVEEAIAYALRELQ